MDVAASETTTPPQNTGKTGSENLKKIVFEPEDCPPLSWYQRNQIDPPKTNVVKIGNRHIDRSEWVKAPEFVPKAQKQASAEPNDANFKQSDPKVVVRAQFSNCRVPLVQQPLGRAAVHNNLAPGPAVRPALVPAPLVPLPPGRVPLVPQGLNPQIRPLMRFPFIQPMFPAPPGGRPLRAFGGNIGGRPLLPQPGLPQGYTANVTAINAGVGAPIPAIVLKKKRKKRRKNKSKSAIFPNEMSTSEILDSSKPKEFSPIDDLDDLASSNSGSTLLTNQRRSEPDLTKLTTNDTSSGVMPKRKNSGSRRAYPNDLDVIQSALDNGHISMTSSCPDLSEAQKELFNEFWDLQNGDIQFPISENLEENSRNPDEFEVSSPPITSAIQTALEASEGKITSPAVKDLDRQIQSEMALTRQFDDSLDNEFASDAEDDDDQIFDRLIKTQQNERVTSFPGVIGRSLLEEIEEKEFLFPDRAPVHLAVVQGKNGANSMVLNGKQGRDKFTRDTVDALFHHSSFDDEENEQDDMHITVNTFEDPEELILDEDDSRKINGTFSQIRETIKGLKRSKSADFPLYPPKSQVCCSVM